MLICFTEHSRKKSANEWLRRLQADSCKKRPSAEQLQFIQAVVDICVQEACEEQGNVEYRSEPARLILHGVPGDCIYVSTYVHMYICMSVYVYVYLHV